MVDDKLNYIKNPSPIELNKASYVVLDLETTGLNCYYDRIIQFGGVKVEHGMVTDSLSVYINPERPLPKKIVQVTGITPDAALFLRLFCLAICYYRFVCRHNDAIGKICLNVSSLVYCPHSHI